MALREKLKKSKVKVDESLDVVWDLITHCTYFISLCISYKNCTYWLIMMTKDTCFKFSANPHRTGLRCLLRLFKEKITRYSSSLHCLKGCLLFSFLRDLALEISKRYLKRLKPSRTFEEICDTLQFANCFNAFSFLVVSLLRFVV